LNGGGLNLINKGDERVRFQPKEIKVKGDGEKIWRGGGE